MKVLLTSHFPLFGCGSGNYIKSLIKNLPKSSVQTAIVGFLEQPSREIYSNEYVLDASRSINDRFPVFTFHENGGRTFRQLSNYEIQLYLNQLCDGLANAIDKFDPDVIHVNHFWLFATAAVNTKLPFVVTIHGSELSYLSEIRWTRYLDPICAARIPLIANSSFTAQQVSANLPITTTELRVIPFGPSATVQSKRMNHGDQQKPPLVLYCGKLTAQKRVDVLIQAAGIYEHGLPGVKTVIYGDGPEEIHLREMVSALGLKRCHLMGTIPADEVNDVMEDASVYVSPCPEEGLGLAPLEACSQGVPVIAAAGGAHLETISSAVGQLFRPGDYQELAGYIVRAVREDWKGKLRNNCRGLITEHFNIEAHITRLMQLYEDIAGRTGTRQI